MPYSPWLLANMITLPLPRSADDAYRAFCDVSVARLWVPGLKRVTLVRSDASGHALEVAYEFGDALSYALVYHYDDATRRVRWVPSAGALDGISGQASFEASDGGCRFTLDLHSVRGRSPNHEDDVARAFADWLRPLPVAG